MGRAVVSCLSHTWRHVCARGVGLWNHSCAEVLQGFSAACSAWLCRALVLFVSCWPTDETLPSIVAQSESIFSIVGRFNTCNLLLWYLCRKRHLSKGRVISLILNSRFAVKLTEAVEFNVNKIVLNFKRYIYSLLSLYCTKYFCWECYRKMSLLDEKTVHGFESWCCN